MKRTFIVSIILLLIAAGLPAVFLPQKPKAQPEETADVSWLPGADEKAEITLLTSDGPAKLSMRDYIVGVVAAEMPVKFEPEALKAQAVCARTYAMYCIRAGKKHTDADVCADPACCQAYRSESELRTSWGDSFDANLEKIKKAVNATDGEYLVYGGEPILAAFHSSSGGFTEDSADAWQSGREYLKSVSSPETAEDVPNYISTVTASPLDFRDTVLSKHPEADFTGKENTWVGKIENDGSGRIKTIVLGGVKVAGEEMRQLFSLRSTQFALKYSDGDFVFSVTGYGHGVGMSQYGANVMAQNGSGYADILTHYYPSAEIRR